MKKVKILGKEYPYKLTISACKKFKSRFDVDVPKADPSSVEQLQYLLWFGVEAGAKIENISLNIDIETLDDLDIEELASALGEASDNIDPK